MSEQAISATPGLLVKFGQRGGGCGTGIGTALSTRLWLGLPCY